MFTDQTLSSLDPAYAGKWRKYLNLKSCFYMAYVSTLGGSSHSLLSVWQGLHREWGLKIALAFFPCCEEGLCSVSSVWSVFGEPNEIAAVGICCDYGSLIEVIQVEHNGHLCYLHHSLILGTIQSWASLWRPWMKLHQVPVGAFQELSLFAWWISKQVQWGLWDPQLLNLLFNSCSLPQPAICFFLILYKRPKLSSLRNCLSLRLNL